MAASGGSSTLRRVSVVFDMVWNGGSKLKQIQTGIDDTVKRLTGMENATAKIATAWAGLFAARMVWQEIAQGAQMVAQAFQRVVDITEEGAGLEQLERSFTRLNETVIKSPTLLDEMTRASQGTITEMKSMEGFMTLVAGQTASLTREFAAATPELVQIAKAANVLNPSLGDTTFFFESLARGIKRAEVRLIDNLGLNLKVGDATKRLAAQLGKSVEALSAEERQIAILNETLRVGRLLVQQVGDDIDAVGDPIQRMRTDWEEMVNAFKQGAANEIIPAIREMDLALEEITGDSAKASQAFGVFFGGGFGGTIANILAPVEGIIKFTESMKDLLAVLNAGNKDSERWSDFFQILMLFLSGGEVGRDIARVTWELERLNEERKKFSTDNLVGQWQRWQDAQAKSKARETQKEMNNTLRAAIDLGLGYRELDKAMADYGRTDELLEEAEKRRKARMEELEDAIKSTTDAIEEQNDVIAEAIKRRQEMIAATGDLFTEQMNAERGSGLYKQAIEDIGTAWVRVGGRSEEQNALLEDLQTAYEKAGKEVRDYSTGIKGFGQDQEKVNEKIADAQARMQHYGEQIRNLEAVQGNLQQVQITAVWNQEAINDMLYTSADAAGASATQLAMLKIATGELSDEQAIAALKAAAMATKIEEFGEAIARGMDPQRALQFIKDFQSELDQADFSVLIEPKIAPRNRVGGDPTGELLKDLPREEREFEIEARTEQATDDIGTFFDLVGGATDQTYDATVNAVVNGMAEIDELQTKLNAIEGEYKVLIDAQVSGDVPSTPGGAEANASGTSYFGGGRTWVGESGPELLTLPRGTRIDGAHRTQPGGGTTIIVNNYNRKAEATSMALVKLRARGVW